MGRRPIPQSNSGPLDTYVVVTKLDTGRQKTNFVDSMRKKIGYTTSPVPTRRSKSKAMVAKQQTPSTPHTGTSQTTLDKCKLEDRSPQEESSAKRDCDDDVNDSLGSLDFSCSAPLASTGDSQAVRYP